MASVEILSPFTVFRDVDGSPLDAGYVYIGVSGLNPVTNPIVVCWDFAMAIPADQPIRTLAGMPSRAGAPSRLYADSDYSITVKDKNGTIIFSSLSILSLTRDDSTIVVQSTLAGAVARTQHAKNSDVVSVKDFGAVGSNSALDTAAFRAAALALSTTGGTIYAPGGVTYLVKSCRVYPNTRILGDGPGNTIIQQPAAMTSGDRVTDDGTGHNLDGAPIFYSAYPASGRNYGIALENLTLDGNGLNQVAGGVKQSWGTYFNGVEGVKITNCEIKNALNHGGCLKEANDCVIDRCAFTSNGQSATIWDPADGTAPKGDGFVLLSQCYDNVVSNCIAESNTAIGFEDEGRFGTYSAGNRNYRNKWVNLTSKSNGDHNYLVLFCDYSHWRNLHSINGSTNGINIVGCTYPSVDGITIYKPTNHAIWVRPEAFGADGTNYHVSIKNAVVYDTGGYILRCEDCQGGEFEIHGRDNGGAHAFSFPTVASSNITLKVDYDGSVGSKASYGIYMYNPINFTINGCRIKSCASHNIWVDGTASGASGIVIRDTVSILSGARGFNMTGGVISGYNNAVDNCDFSRCATRSTDLASKFITTTGNIIGFRKTHHASAAPTTGNWDVGDRIINSVPTVGQPKAWVTSVAGTAGTLAGCTGDITTGTKLLTVNATTGISLDDYLTIAGVTGVKRVIDITGLVVTIDSNADATVAGAAVAYQAPTFVSEGNL